MTGLTIKSFEDTEVAFSYKSDRDLKKAHFLFTFIKRPFMADLATRSAKFSLKVGLPVEKLIKRTVFDHFCGGVTISDCQLTVETLSKYNVILFWTIR